MFTEFMEQRAPGHTVADGKIYARGMDGFKADMDAAAAAVEVGVDPLASRRLEELRAMRIAADAAVRFAERHAELAEAHGGRRAGRRPPRRARADRRGLPPRAGAAPRDFWEAVQMYWFCHLAVITELNGWDAYSPGHLDQHLEPFYQRGIADGTLTRERAKELLGCLFVKFNNHPAPPKVGVTAAESGTYTDFAGIALGGIRRDGTDGVGEVSYLLLEVIDELHLVQPSPNVQLSRVTPEHFLRETCKVVRKGYGYPALFNADGVVTQLLRKGKSVEDAREGGTSGCVETGAYGKEAYVLTGYFNLPKILELALHDGLDPRTGRQLGPRTGDPRDFATFDDLFAAWTAQLHHFVDIKIRGNALIERHLRGRHAGAVPVAHHQRLHREGDGLQRGRRPLQHHLHPGRGHRHRDRRPRGAAGPGVRRAACRWASCSAALDADFDGQRAAPPAAPQPGAQVGQRRRGRRRDHAGGPSGRSWTRSTAGRTSGAARTAWTCCPRPATSTSAG